QGYKGLSIGLEICLNLMDKFWDTMFPPLKRIRGRSAAFIWLASRITPLIQEKAPSQNDAEAIQSSAITMEKLVQMIDEKFGSNTPTNSETPNLLDLRKVLQGYALKFKAEEKKVEEKPKTETTEKPAEQVQPKTTATTATTAPTEFTSAVNAHQVIARACGYLRGLKPDDPIPYKLIRIIRWYPVESLPPAVNGKTQIPGILPQLVQGFQNLFNGGEWETLLRQSEANFSNSPFWFDLQRFIDRAMTELGPTYTNARQAVRVELATLIKRLPNILNLTFNNDIPFADDQTKMWIEADVLASIASAQPTTSQPDKKESEESSSEGNIDEIVKEAKRIAVGGKLEDGISLLKKHLLTASLGREQFIWKLNIAKLCLDAGNPRLALPQLESLDEEIKKYSLEQWEPELATEAVKSLYQCRSKLMQDIKQPAPQLAELIDELYARLCRLDVLSALLLDKK
ncbi:TPA: type VI secretion system protein TssA, partial [bacterium]|nr:type VI secretion system protein TssA [bacterium]